MAIASASGCIESIGNTAGEIWHVLHDRGPLPISKLIQEIDAPRDLVLQGIGWLGAKTRSPSKKSPGEK